MSETRTFWLSFCDDKKPKGQQFLGVSVVDVTLDDADLALLSLNPLAAKGAEWIAAAIRKAWKTGCNPGGQVGSMDVTDAPERFVDTPKHVLMQKPDLKKYGHLS